MCNSFQRFSKYWENNTIKHDYKHNLLDNSYYRKTIKNEFKFDTSTNTKDSTYHKDCLNILINQSSDWIQINKPWEKELFVIKQMSILQALNNRKIGLKFKQKHACIECLINFMNSYTLTYRSNKTYQQTLLNLKTANHQ